ncbi:MAG: DUF63 family protein [archaeon]
MAFIEEYFVNPIISGTGYNPVNTVTYIAVALVLLYATVVVFRKMRITANDTLFHDIAPFVFLGGVLRALQDIQFFAPIGVFQYFFVTPLIYFSLYATVLALIVIQSKTKKRVVRITGWTALSLALIVAAVNLKRIDGLLIALALFCAVFGLVYLAMKKAKQGVLRGVNVFPFAGHALDACSSVTAITIVGGFTEQHVLPNIIFSYIPFWTFIPIKVAIVLAALYVVDRDVSDVRWRFALKMLLFALGMGPGVRNTLAMAI